MNDSVEGLENGLPDQPDVTSRLPESFRLIGRLSTTEMSEVFLAREETQQGDHREVALKVVFPGSTRDPSLTRERFERECQTAVRLEHRNVVPAFSWGRSSDGEMYYLATHYVADGSLRELLRTRGVQGAVTAIGDDTAGDAQGVLSLEETIAIAGQVAAALDFAHSQGLVHRDVKPENILVERRTQQVYLTDFGIAKDFALATVTTSSGPPHTALYAAPEQHLNKAFDHRIDIYALGRVIRECLTGHPMEKVGPVQMPDPVHRVLDKATSPDPEERPATCRRLVEDLAAAARPSRPTPAVTVALIGLLVAVAALLAFILPGRDSGRKQATPPPPFLDRVPRAFRDGCKVPSPSTSAVSTLSCRDGDGRPVEVALHADHASVERSYDRAVGEAAVPRAQGDCRTATGGEHRYPATGPARGRVLCYVRDGRAVLLWTDEQARTVSRTESPAAEAAALHRSWSSWFPVSDFPTPGERGLLDHAAGTECVRSPAADLQAFPGAVASVRCVPWGSGARTLSYYRFASLPDLREAMTASVDSVDAPFQSSCATGTAPGFLGTQRHGWLGVDLGQVLCRPMANGMLAMEWTMEPLSMVGSVTGDRPDALATWWSEWHLASLDRVVNAVNSRSKPPFPTDAERRLLERIPPISRRNCVRPSTEQVWRDIGSVPAVGVACGRTSGAELVVYYQFKGVGTMRQVFNSTGDFGDGACTSLPEEFSAERRYTRDDGSTGRLRCGVVERTGERFLEWTDERLAVAAFAHHGNDRLAMIDWWTHDAGPR